MSKTPAPKPKKPKTRVVGFRADDELYADMERAALKKQWSVSQWIAITLRAALGRK